MAGKRKSSAPTEHQEQATLIQFAGLRSRVVPEWGLLFAVPNGGHRHKAVAAKLQKEGVRSGVSDLVLPVARQGFHGVFVEMKSLLGKPTPAQQEWLQAMALQGYATLIAHGWIEAATFIAGYLGDSDAIKLIGMNARG